MGLDPDVLLAKPVSRVAEWLAYAQADMEYDDFKAEEAQAALERQLKGGS